MRTHLDAPMLSPHRPLASSSGRTSSGVGQAATFQQILQQQPDHIASTPFSTFGSTPNGPDPTGGQTYNPMSNPLLTPQISSTDINGTLVTQNTSPTVTAAAAQQFAKVLGGTVVQLDTPWANMAPAYGIELPGGQRIDATAIANVLGNNAAFPSAAVKSGEIAKLMGVEYSPGMANLATQLAGGANANLPPLTAGVGVMSPPLLTPADGRVPWVTGA